MRAAQLFSAALHIAAIAALAAVVLRSWLNANRLKKQISAEFVAIAGFLALIVAIADTVLSRTGRGFGASLTTALAAGALAGLAFLLTLETLRPPRTGFLDPPNVHIPVSKVCLVSALVLTEVVASSLLVASVGRASSWS